MQWVFVLAILSTWCFMKGVRKRDCGVTAKAKDTRVLNDLLCGTVLVRLKDSRPEKRFSAPLVLMPRRESQSVTWKGKTEMVMGGVWQRRTGMPWSMTLDSFLPFYFFPSISCLLSTQIRGGAWRMNYVVALTAPGARRRPHNTPNAPLHLDTGAVVSWWVGRYDDLQALDEVSSSWFAEKLSSSRDHLSL